MHEPTTTDFTLDGDDYSVVRYAAPTNRSDWVELLGLLLDCPLDEAAVAYDAMFPDGYDPDGTDEVALVPHAGARTEEV